MKKKFLAVMMMAAMTLSLAACGSSNKENSNNDAGTASEAAQTEETGTKSDFKASMVTDTGGVNDQSFNQSAWEGLQQVQKETGAEVTYLESTQESDYTTNLDKQVDEGSKLVWGIGFAMADAILESAEVNDEVNFAIVDNAYEEVPANVTCVTFNAQDSSFLVGYIAGQTTETNKVGFIGGISSNIIDQFEYGYRAGVQYAADELGKEIEVDVQYADSFSDSAKGKAIATTMYSNGCDIVFHAAGGVGIGVIEAAVEADKYVIGVDSDQSYLAPDNVLTSALKRVDVAVANITEMAMNGEKIGGQTFTYGLPDGGVGIPEQNPNLKSEVYDKAMKIQEKIAGGEIVPPYNAELFESFNQ